MADWIIVMVVWWHGGHINEMGMFLGAEVHVNVQAHAECF